MNKYLPSNYLHFYLFDQADTLTVYGDHHVRGVERFEPVNRIPLFFSKECKESEESTTKYVKGDIL